jgi:RNA polymerase sigma factor (sigma-70 family)
MIASSELIATSAMISQQETNEELLQHFDYYIIYQARSLVHRYSRSAIAEQLDEADELIQRTRIKFWQVLNKSHIEYPRAYLKRIIFTEFSDMKRQQKTQPPLSLDEDWAGNQLEQLENAPDPADEVEQRQEDEEFIQKVIRLILQLPPRQRSAIICLLLDQADDPTYFAALLKKHELNVESLQWPSGKAEKKLLQASLYIARQTLAKNLHIDIHTRKRRRAL